MNTRIKELRKTLNLTQTIFGEKIGIKGNTVTNYENGLRNPSEAVIKSICREFNVNENWLRTGKGEMFNEISKENEISKWVNNVLKDRPDNFKKRLLTVLSTLNENEWEFLEQKARELISYEKEVSQSSENKNNELSANENSTTTEEVKKIPIYSKSAYEMTDEEINEEVEAYRQQLIFEKKQKEELSASQKDKMA